LSLGDAPDLELCPAPARVVWPIEPLLASSGSRFGLAVAALAPLWHALVLQSASRPAPLGASSSVRLRLASAVRLRPGPARAPTFWQVVALPSSFAPLRQFAAAALPSLGAWPRPRAASLLFLRAADRAPPPAFWPGRGRRLPNPSSAPAPRAAWTPRQ